MGSDGGRSRSRAEILPGAWTVRPLAPSGDVPPAARKALPAVVPGCVHRDLIRAGVIVHPDRADAEDDQAWIGRTDWGYEGTFDAPADLLAHDRLDLVCAGLDTVAAVSVNGTPVGTAANAHHPHRFDVGPAVRPGSNALSIAFRGPLAYVEAQERALGPRPVNGDWGPYAYARKPACDFGWDWGPRVPTVGIRRPLAVVGWSGVRLAAMRPLVTEATARRATVEVRAIIERAAPGATGVVPVVDARLTAPDGRVLTAATTLDGGAGDVRLTIPIDDPQRWWPRGLGSPALHDLRVTLRAGDAVVDVRDARVGLRTVRLDTTPDGHGTPFTLFVNDTPVFARGANWIPDGLFGATPVAERRRIEQACAANMNMLRVWGGGGYASTAFYETCDALGVLVWQDFMFACATYPEEPPYPALVEAEARHQVDRLARHPSVVLWCGGNENIEAWACWGWRERLDPSRSWGRGYWLDLLPGIVAELDPTRPYWPDSPWSGTLERSPRDPDHGDRHTWDARIEGYRRSVPRFVSEFGHQGPPNLATLRTALGAEALRLHEPALARRQRAGGGDARQYGEPLAAWFAPPADFAGWHYLAQLLQARAVEIGVTWLRAHRGRCMGALVWQLNDAWTGPSWSAIDVAGRPKPAWHALRRAFAPQLVTWQPGADGRPRLVLVNDAAEPWEAAVLARRVRFDGQTAATAQPVALVEPGSVAWLDPDLGMPDGDERRRALLVADVAGARATWFFDRDHQLEYPPSALSVRVRREPGATELALTAHTLLRDVVLRVDAVAADAAVDEQLVTLLPGETHAFRITTARPLDLDRLLAPPVFACANRYGRRG